MTTQSLHTFGSSLQAMPVAMIFTKQLLLTQKSSSPATEYSSDSLKEQTYTVRATTLTMVLKNIPGFSHGGLND